MSKPNEIAHRTPLSIVLPLTLAFASTTAFSHIPDNLTSVPTGEAKVEFEYWLSNIGATGEDGVRFIADFFTQEWNAEHLRLVPLTLDWTATIEVLGRRGGSLVTPSLAVAEQAVPGGAYQIEYSATFGRSTYRIELYDGDLLVGRSFGIDSGEPGATSANDPICDALGKAESVALGVCEWVVAPGFQQNDNGECQFELSGARKEWTVDGSRIEADRILFIEELSAPPETASFRLITIQGTELRSGQIRNQSIERQ